MTENHNTHCRRVGIVGSRDFLDIAFVEWFVRGLPTGTIIVSGGARGVDAAAARAARQVGHEVIEHRPSYAEYGRRAPLVRNFLIVDGCDRLVAFWDGKSTGTMHTVRIAKAKGKPVEVFRGAQDTREPRSEAARAQHEMAERLGLRRVPAGGSK